MPHAHRHPQDLPVAEVCKTCQGLEEVSVGRPPLELFYVCPLCHGAGIVAAEENRVIDLASVPAPRLVISDRDARGAF